MFSLTLPLTKIATTELSFELISFGRAAGAAILGSIYLLVRKNKSLPSQQDLKWLAIVVCGVVVGYPLFSAKALTDMDAASSSVISGLIPIATASFALLVLKEKLSKPIAISIGLGTAAIFIFWLASGSRLYSIQSYVWMNVSILLAGAGYAAGAKLTGKLGALGVISWGLVLSSPITFPITLMELYKLEIFPSARVIYSLLYLSIVSMFIGFAFWYQGLYLGGTGKIGRIQLIQPFLSLFFAYLVLSEEVSSLHLVFATVVILCLLVKDTATIRNKP